MLGLGKIDTENNVLTDEPLLEPIESYEQEGKVSNVVFACGAVVINGTIHLYYGGADTVIGVATMPLTALTELLLDNKTGR